MGAVSRSGPDKASAPPGYQTVADAAEKSGVPDWQIRRWLNDGTVPGVRFGGGVRSVWLVPDHAIARLGEASHAE